MKGMGLTLTPAEEVERWVICVNMREDLVAQEFDP
jgi:hypothetical protein